MQTEENVLSNAIALSINDQNINQSKHVNSLIHRWGGSSSNAILDPACTTFSTPSVDGVIGYRIACGCAVVFGDPICPPNDIPKLTEDFHTFCKNEGNEVVYISTTPSFSNWAFKKVCRTIVEWGTDIIIDPFENPWSKTGPASSLLRRNVRQAKEAKLSVKEYLASNAILEKAIQEVAVAWLKARHGLQIYLSHVALFNDRVGKRWFYGMQNDQVVGVIVLGELKAFKGWHITNLMMTPNAPHGTHEMLITAVIDTLKTEGCHYLSGGTVPIGKLGRIEGPGSLSKWVINLVFKAATLILHLNGKLRFWKKFTPHYEPAYLLFSRSNIGIKEVSALMRAMNLGL